MGVLAESIRSFWQGPFLSGDKAFAHLFRDGEPASSGAPVSVWSTVGLSAVWACVSLIAGTISSMPLVLYQRLADGGRAKFTRDPLFSVLDSRPNAELPAQAFKESLVTALLLRGVAYAEIVRNNGGSVIELWPLHPDRVQIIRDKNGRLTYRVTGGTNVVTLNDEDMLRIAGPLSDDGLTGRSVIAAARETFGTALALERYAGSFFASAATPTGALSVTGHLSEAARQNLRDSWERAYAGRNGWHKTAILEQGTTFTPISVTNEDAEFIAARRFSVEEICRLFLVPAYLVNGDVKGSLTYSNAEMQMQQLLTFTFAPWMRRIEHAMNRALLPTGATEYIEFLDAALLRADTQSRFAAYATALTAGWLLKNEVRVKENMNPIDGLDAAPSPVGSPGRAAPQVRAWVEILSGRIVRREIAHLKQVARAPAQAAERFATFYSRFDEEGLTELRSWLLRLRPEVVTTVEARLSAWAINARTTCQAAARVGGLESLGKRWELEREAMLTNELLEAIYGTD